jgi:hypothetical protein
VGNVLSLSLFLVSLTLWLIMLHTVNAIRYAVIISYSVHYGPQEIDSRLAGQDICLFFRTTKSKYSVENSPPLHAEFISLIHSATSHLFFEDTTKAEISL